MLISVTAPRKGMGQTITSINISAIITKLTQEKVMLIDANRHCGDIGNYLSDTKITKGLDDFISFHNSNLLNKDSFNACIKPVHNIDIMSANECLELNNKAIKTLLEYTNSIYKTTIIDTISGKNPISHFLFEQSDMVIVVLNQSKHLVDQICKTELYKPYKGKLIFIVNKLMDKFEDKRFNFGLKNITEELRAAGFSDKVFPLAFDTEVVNEGNDGAVLNCILNNNSSEGKYSKQLNNIANYLISDYSSPKILKENKKSNNVLTFLRLKGATPFAT